METEFERATLADALTLVAMNRRLIEDEGDSKDLSDSDLLERMVGWLTADYEAIILRQDGEAVAYALYHDEGDSIYLRHLYVEREARRQGLATMMLDWLFANAWPAKPVRLDVVAGNTDALAFYEDYGFHVRMIQLEKT